MNAQVLTHCSSISPSSQQSWIARGRQHRTGITLWFVFTTLFLFRWPRSSSTGAVGGKVRSSRAPQLLLPRQRRGLLIMNFTDGTSKESILIGTTCCGCCCCCSWLLLLLFLKMVYEQESLIKMSHHTDQREILYYIWMSVNSLRQKVLY